jgi:ABC-type lipoprotein release transport system permease subunit
MTRFTLLLRNLAYFRAANCAVIAGVAVGTAVLTGALLVGDSVRGSLRDLAIQRLGPVDYALVAPRFFDQSLVERLRAQPEAASRYEVVPAILVRGGASDEQGRHGTGGVQVMAMGGSWAPIGNGVTVINSVLADTLGVTAPRARVSLQLPAPGDVPRDATLARRSVDEVTASPTLGVSKIAAEPGFLSAFSLDGSQRLPRNAWMNLSDLQREIRQPKRANVLLARSIREGSVHDLNRDLRAAIRLDDYGLKLTASAATGEQVLSSRTTYIPPAVDDAAKRITDVPQRRVAVQLVNNVVKLDAQGNDDIAIHYAVAAGMSALDDGELKEDEIALNEWAATRLAARAGNRIRLDYYQRRADGELVEVRSDRDGVGLTFRVARILPMTGLGADRSLTPEYAGLTDKPSISEAPPELGIKDDLLTDDDEAYWKQYRAAPKVFLNLDTARKLWGETYGELTSIRVPAQRAARFERELLANLDPAAMGMTFRPIKAEQLAAATAGTDFAGLFVGLSFFLIVSAALLVALLMRLSIEQRARQFGLFQSIGFAPANLYRLALAEGLLLSLVGVVIGLLCAAGYTWLMIAGLRTWWVDAVGTTALQLHVTAASLAIGGASSLVIALLAIVWAARQLRLAQPVQLLSGAPASSGSRRMSRSNRAAWLALVAGVAGAALLIAGMSGALSGEIAFFAGGTLLLVAALSAVAWLLRAAAPWGGRSIASLGVRTASLHATRSLLTVCLIAMASFLLVTVASMRQGPPTDAGVKSSGTGGYRLIASAEIPLLADLNTVEGRAKLGMRDPRSSVWTATRFTSMRRWAGQDASCLNLTRPDSPTILAVPDGMIREKRFTFARTIEKIENPWMLLERSDGEASHIPIIADSETAQYILKLGIGDTLTIRDQSGEPRELRLVATLKGSIFQSELLMGEANFRRLCPFQSGFGIVLADTSADNVQELRRALGEELEPFAVTADSTAERLTAYKQVANTYLATFQALGSLGLLLGTVGLTVVMLRGLFERRAEMALLSAVGFSHARRLKLVMAENATLLLAGVLAGTVCALVAVMPAAVSEGRALRLGGVALTLAAVSLVGLAILTIAVWLGGRNVRPADLRRE